MLLELRTHAVFSATKQMKRIQGHHAEKVLSQWEKGAKCNFKSTAKYMKDVSFSWNEMLLQCRRQIFMVRAFFAEQVMLSFNARESLV